MFVSLMQGGRIEMACLAEMHHGLFEMRAWLRKWLVGPNFFEPPPLHWHCNHDLRAGPVRL